MVTANLNIAPPPPWDEDLEVISLASGDARLFVCNQPTPNQVDDYKSYGRHNETAKKSLRRIELRRSDLKAAGWQQPAALGAANADTNALDQAYQQGVAAALSAATDAKYDAEKFGQQWSVSGLRVRSRT